MSARSHILFLTFAVAAMGLCSGCGMSEAEKRSRAAARKKKEAQAAMVKNGVNYCPERAQLIREGNELYAKGEAAFNRWGTTGDDKDIKDANRYLNASYDKYREAKDTYGDDSALEKLRLKNNSLRKKAMKHVPL